MIASIDFIASTAAADIVIIITSPGPVVKFILNAQAHLKPLHVCHPSSEGTKTITGLLHVQELQFIRFRKGVQVICKE